jgi:uncharacterized protein with HEPN domain
MKEPVVFLKHILDSIVKIEKFMQGVTLSQFVKDDKLNAAVIRHLEIIGEAVKKIPTSLLKKYPEIEWKLIARMRDRLIHKYFDVDLHLTYTVIKQDIYPLKKTILKMINTNVLKK